jgi:UDPglucose--hexose-1-phosphate uridylyltransferase
MTDPSLRFDVTTRDWVAFAPLRSERPTDYSRRRDAQPGAARDQGCAFCPGNEAQTLPAVDVEADPDAPDRWLVRAFANKYPALRPDASTARERSTPLFQRMGGHGAHEVVVCSPHHARPIAELPEAQVTAILRLLQRRQRSLGADPTLELVQIFQNHGERAGSSLPHPHLQIVATPVVPRQIRLKYQVAADYYQAHGVSLYQELGQAELDAKTRVIVETPEFVAFAPFASGFPYQLWIVPRAPAPSFELADSGCLPALGRTLRELLQRMQIALGDPAYNLTFFGAPRRHADEPDFVWHIEIVPRLELQAGFELATGMAINSVLPEVAAETLRRVDLDA